MRSIVPCIVGLTLAVNLGVGPWLLAVNLGVWALVACVRACVRAVNPGVGALARGRMWGIGWVYRNHYPNICLTNTGQFDTVHLLHNAFNSGLVKKRGWLRMALLE